MNKPWPHELPDVSAVRILAIVVTHNGVRWVERCFGSLVASRLPVEVIAIDNASTDGTADLIEQRFPGVEVLRTGENLGFGRANNLGLRQVLDRGAEYAFLLNQDAWISPETIERLVVCHRVRSEYGILSPVHINGVGDALDFNFSQYLCPWGTPGIYSDAMLHRLGSVYETRFVNAAAWLLSAEFLRQVGGFDPLFRHYGEDEDLVRRARYRGFKVGVVPTALAWHDRPQPEAGFSPTPKRSLSIQALLLLKDPECPLPTRNFLWRKIIAEYLTLLLVYRGANPELRESIRLDRLRLRHLPEVRAQRERQARELTPFLIMPE